MERHPPPPGQRCFWWQLAADRAAAGAGAAFRGGAPGPQPDAQPVAPSHGAGSAGSPGALPARSTAGLSKQTKALRMPKPCLRNAISV